MVILLNLIVLPSTNKSATLITMETPAEYWWVQIDALMAFPTTPSRKVMPLKYTYIYTASKQLQFVYSQLPGYLWWKTNLRTR